MTGSSTAAAMRPALATISDNVTRPKSGYPNVAAVPAPVM